jgi:hypothetical protein
MQVRQVMSEASSSLIQLRLVAATAEKEEAAAARGGIRRLERLLSRGAKKIRSLDKENAMRVRKKRAEQNEQKERAKKIEDELRKKEKARKAREQSYLRESGQGLAANPYARWGSAKRQLAPQAWSEAEIAAKAARLAAIESSLGFAAGIAGGNGAGPIDGGSSEGGGDGGAVAAEGVVAGLETPV